MKMQDSPQFKQMPSEEQTKLRKRKDAFASIAFWQLLIFVMLICFLWASEILHIPEKIFGFDDKPMNLYRAFWQTIAVLAAAIITVGHTYEQQRKLLKKLLETCMYCHRVKDPSGKWEYIEDYFIHYYPVPMQRGICEECTKMLRDVDTTGGGKK